MSILQKIAISAFGNLLLAVTAHAAITLPAGGATLPENPYSDITNRNIFGLHDADHTPPPNPEVPKPNIKFTGIITIGGSKRALLIVNSMDAGAKAPTAHSLMLGEGERFDGLQILEINPQARTVRIKSDKFESPLDFCLAEPTK